MTLIIRKYRLSDHESVLKLHVEGLNQFHASIGDPKLDKDIQNIENTYIRRYG